MQRTNCPDAASCHFLGPLWTPGTYLGPTEPFWAPRTYLGPPWLFGAQAFFGTLLNIWDPRDSFWNPRHSFERKTPNPNPKTCEIAKQIELD